MNMDFDNPYAAPNTTGQERAPAMRWRIFPAAASFLFGVASFGVGLAAVAIMSYLLWRRQGREALPGEATLGSMVAGCSLYLGFGASWMLAGWYYWKARYRHGITASAFGNLIPVVLFAIFGF